jgi:hypothetical protein
MFSVPPFFFFTIFEILSPAEIRNNLERHNENVQDLLYNYYGYMGEIDPPSWDMEYLIGIPH